MQPSETDRALRPVSYVALGLLATAGPQTSYDLARNAELSVSHFWPVTRSQLYAEPKRLEDVGLVSSTQEDTGRRRRTFAITDAGRAALVDWLHTPAEPSRYHDPAMLRLFFTDVEPAAARSLAERRVGELMSELQVLEHPGVGGDQPTHLRVLAWGRATLRADLAFWQSVLDDLEAQP